MPEAGPRRVRSLGVAAPGDVRLFDLDDEPLADGGFRVATEHSGISAGTELTWVKGTNPFLSAAWDARAGVFRTDRPATRYPVEVMGYMEVGRVTDSRADGLAEGTRVAMAYGHRTGYTAHPSRDRFVVVPEHLDPVLGVFVAHMGPICANGLLHAAAEVQGATVTDLGAGVRGRRVLVIGGGVVGLLTGLLARVHGAASVAVVDPTPARRDAARALGLVALDDDADAPAWRAVKEGWAADPRAPGADVVFQCRGRADALVTALRSLRPQGTVIDLAFYTEGAPGLRLGEEFHHGGLGLRAAQIGRVPRELSATWDRRRLSAETLELLVEAGDAVRATLVTEVVPFDDGPAVLTDLAARRRHTLTSVLSFGP